MPTSQSGFIYLLSDPRDMVPYYVGKTTLTVAKRLKAHLQMARLKTDKKLYPVHEWIKILARQGLTPVYREIEYVEKGLATREIYWISKFLQVGAPLCNIDGVKDSETRLAKKLEQERIDALMETIATQVNLDGHPYRRMEVAQIAYAVYEWGVVGIRAQTLGASLRQYFSTPHGPKMLRLLMDQGIIIKVSPEHVHLNDSVLVHRDFFNGQSFSNR